MILVKHDNLGNLEPYFYFALEQYIMENLLKDDETYFFTWQIKGVVIGKNQVLENEVNLDFLKENNIKVFRRPTGGGCVYADSENTMYSIITKRQKEGPFSFKTYLQKLIDSTNMLGINLSFSGRNDIIFQDKKVSGTAYLQNKHGVLIHGTFLYNCDLVTMVKAITPSDEKLISKGVSSVRSRVVNLKPYLNGISQDELIKHWENTMTNKVYELSLIEIEHIKKMALVYSAKEYTFTKQPMFTKKLSKRLQAGMIELSLDIKEGIIKKLNIGGDYFEIKPIGEFQDHFIDLPYQRASIADILKNFPIENYIVDAVSEEFLALITSGIVDL